MDSLLARQAACLGGERRHPAVGDLKGVHHTLTGLLARLATEGVGQSDDVLGGSEDSDGPRHPHDHPGRCWEGQV
jgi:hypothetical protein